MLSPPTPISEAHDLTSFDCGKPVLDDWLRQRALRSEGQSARTYVVCNENIVVGYYCIATGGVSHAGLPGKLKRNMPDPIPVMVVGRLAVDKNHQGRKIGRGLLKDALQRILALSKVAGIRAVMLHAMDEDAAKFYLKYGFIEYPGGSRTMFLPIESIQAAL